MTCIIRSRNSVTWNVAATLVWSSLRDEGSVRIVVRRRDAARVFARASDWWRILDVNGMRAYAVENVYCAPDGSVRADARLVNIHRREAAMVLSGPHHG